MALKPILTTGIALAGAAAIVAATPAVLPTTTPDTQVATTAAEAMRTLNADYTLSALSLDGFIAALTGGYGGVIDHEDEIAPRPDNPDTDWVDESDPVTVGFPFGALYYLIDNTIGAGTNIENYFVERDLLETIHAAYYEISGEVPGSNDSVDEIVDTIRGSLGGLLGLNGINFGELLGLDGINLGVELVYALNEIPVIGPEVALFTAYVITFGPLGAVQYVADIFAPGEEGGDEDSTGDGEVESFARSVAPTNFVEDTVLDNSLAIEQGKDEDSEGESSEDVQGSAAPTNPFAKFTKDLPSPIAFSKLTERGKEVVEAIIPTKQAAPELAAEVEKPESSKPEVESSPPAPAANKGDVKKGDTKKVDFKKPFKRFTVKERGKKPVAGGQSGSEGVNVTAGAPGPDAGEGGGQNNGGPTGVEGGES